MSDEITAGSVNTSHLQIKEGYFDRVVEMIHGDGWIETDTIVVETDAGRELVITSELGNVEVRRQ